MLRVYFSLVACFGSLASAADNAADIVRRSALVDQSNDELAKNYTYLEREVERKLDSGGAQKSIESKTWDTTFLYGRPFRRLVEKDGKPLPPDQQKKEQERFDREVAKRERESDKDRAHAVAEQEKRRREGRKFLQEIADVYDFRILGEEQVSGRDAWVIGAEPKRDYKPTSSDAKNLMKMHGKVWIEKDGYHWVKAEAEVIDTLSWGLFLARMSPGTRLEFEQERVNDEVWLPRRMLIRLNARLMFKKFDAEYESDWSNYRKFTSDSKLTGTGESN